MRRWICLVPSQHLARFDSLLQQLSAEGKSVLQSLAFITLQNVEDGEAESQRRRVDEADLSSVLDTLDPPTMNAMMISTDFDVLLALNADYSVSSLEDSLAHL
ncbi:hypothetical protein B566_EDAN007513 [Ephemera danica]|nr:hypothetical protein B566_EDAN007513 [Ephemera danica]